MATHRNQKSTATCVSGLQKESQVVHIDIADIQLRRFHRSLTARQLARAKQLWSRVGTLIEEERSAARWIDDFCYDLYPNIELGVWEQVADVFERVCDDGVARRL